MGEFSRLSRYAKAAAARQKRLEQEDRDRYAARHPKDPDGEGARRQARLETEDRDRYRERHPAQPKLDVRTRATLSGTDIPSQPHRNAARRAGAAQDSSFGAAVRAARDYARSEPWRRPRVPSMQSIVAPPKRTQFEQTSPSLTSRLDAPVFRRAVADPALAARSDAELAHAQAAEAKLTGFIERFGNRLPPELYGRASRLEADAQAAFERYRGSVGAVNERPQIQTFTLQDYLDLTRVGGDLRPREFGPMGSYATDTDPAGAPISNDAEAKLQEAIVRSRGIGYEPTERDIAIARYNLSRQAETLQPLERDVASGIHRVDAVPDWLAEQNLKAYGEEAKLRHERETLRAGLMGDGAFGLLGSIVRNPGEYGRFLQRGGGQLLEQVEQIPAGLKEAAAAVYGDVTNGPTLGDLASGNWSAFTDPENLFPRSRALAEGTVAQIREDFQHPYERWGYILPTVVAGASLGASAAFRAGAALSGGINVAKEAGLRAGLKTAVKEGVRPTPGTATLRVPGEKPIEVELSLSRNPFRAALQAGNVRRMNRKLAEGPGAGRLERLGVRLEGPNPEQAGRVRSAGAKTVRGVERAASVLGPEAKVGRELRAQRRVYAKRWRAAYNEHSRLTGKFALTDRERAAIQLVSFEGQKALDNPAAIVAKHVEMHDQWIAETRSRRDRLADRLDDPELTKPQKKQLEDRIRGLDDELASLQSRIGIVRAAEKVLAAPTESWLAALQSTRYLSKRRIEELVKRGIVSTTVAERREATPSALFEGRELKRDVIEHRRLDGEDLKAAQERVDQLEGQVRALAKDHPDRRAAQRELAQARNELAVVREQVLRPGAERKQAKVDTYRKELADWRSVEARDRDHRSKSPRRREEAEARLVELEKELEPKIAKFAGEEGLVSRRDLARINPEIGRRNRSIRRLEDQWSKASDKLGDLRAAMVSRPPKSDSAREKRLDAIERQVAKVDELRDRLRAEREELDVFRRKNLSDRELNRNAAEERYARALELSLERAQRAGSVHPSLQRAVDAYDEYVRLRDGLKEADEIRNPTPDVEEVFGDAPRRQGRQLTREERARLYGTTARPTDPRIAYGIKHYERKLEAAEKALANFERKYGLTKVKEWDVVVGRERVPLAEDHAPIESVQRDRLVDTMRQAGLSGDEQARVLAIADARARAYNPAEPAAFYNRLDVGYGGPIPSGALYSLLHGKEPPYYSKLERAAAQLPEKLTVQQARAALKKAGVKDAELVWTGVSELLDAHEEILGGKITRARIEERIADRGLELEERVSSEGAGDRGVERVGRRWSETPLDENHPPEQAVEDFHRDGEVEVLEEHAYRHERGGHAVDVVYVQRVRDVDPAEDYVGPESWRVLSPGPEEEDGYSGWWEAGRYRSRGRAMEVAEAEAHQLDIERPNDVDTQYDTYVADGPHASGYREVRLVLPRAAYGPLHKGPHWPEQNVVLHARFTNRSLPSSGVHERALVLEELQSDWHQAERKYGLIPEGQGQDLVRIHERHNEATRRLGEIIHFARYEFGAGKLEEMDAALANPDFAALRARWASEADPGPWGETKLDHFVWTRDRWRRLDQLVDGLSDERILADAAAARKVNPGPFSKHWQELGVRRVFDEWARKTREHDYDVIAWPTGGQIADGFGLGRRFHSIEVKDAGPSGKQYVSLRAYGREGMPDLDAGFTIAKADLGDYIGEDRARAAIAAVRKGETWTTYDLEMSGTAAKGIRTFYDEQLPRLMEREAKKHGGAKVKLEQVHEDGTHWHVLRFVDRDAARESIRAGQELMERRRGRVLGAVRFEDDRTILRAFKGADLSTFVHELGHIIRRDLPLRDLAVLEAHLGVKEGRWEVKHEEAFAQLLVDHVEHTAKAPPQVRGVLRRIKRWIAETWAQARGRTPKDAALYVTMERILADAPPPASPDVIPRVPGAFYSPVMQSLRLDQRVSPYTTPTPGPHGVTGPDVNRIDPNVTHELSGASFRSGNYSFDAPKATAIAYARMVRLVSAFDLYEQLYGVRQAVRSSRWQVPIRDPGNLPPRLKKAIADAQAGDWRLSRDALDELSESETAELVGYLHAADRKGLVDAPMGTDLSAEGIYWIDRRLIASMGDIRTPGRGKTIASLLNDPARILSVYGRVAYILNLPGNLGMQLIHQGFLAPYNYRRAWTIRSWAGDEIASTIESLVGEGKAKSYALDPEFDTAPLERVSHAMAGFWSSWIDRPSRVSAFLHEAAREGFRTPEELNRLLFDGRHNQTLVRVTRQANKALVEFDNLLPFERNVLRHWIFFYPWVSRSAVWTLRTMIEHPGKTWALTELAQYAQDRRDEQLGPLPGYLKNRGYFPVFWRDDTHPYLVDLTSVNTFASPAEIGRILGGLVLGGDRPAPREAISPAAEFFAALVTGTDPFGREFDGGRLQGALGAFFQSLGPISALRRAGVLGEEDFSKKPLERQPVFQDRGLWAGLGPWLAGGAFPRAADLEVANARAERERRLLMGPVERKVEDSKKARTELEKVAGDVSIAGVVRSKEVQRAFNLRWQRRIGYERYAHRHGKKSDELTQLERLQVDLRVQRQAGAISGKLADVRLRAARTQDADWIEKQRLKWNAEAEERITWAHTLINRLRKQRGLEAIEWR